MCCDGGGAEGYHAGADGMVKLINVTEYMVKKIIFFSILAVMAISCLDSLYNASYQVAATFEVDAEFNEDSIYYEQMLGVSNVFFLNKCDENGEFGGLVLSQAHNLHTDECSPYSVYDTSAYADSKVFMLYFNNPVCMPDHDIWFTQAASGTCKPTGCLVHNTTRVVGAVKDNFTDGDWLKLTATGYLNGTQTGTAEIYLADFRESKDSIVTTWTPFDLQGLGSIEYIDFDITSSKEDGIVPKNFCMDNFYASVSITSE